MIILVMVVAFLTAFGLVHLVEYVWLHRPPCVAFLWPKPQAMRFTWAITAFAVFISCFPAGLFIVAAGAPVCFTHLALVDKDSRRRISVGDVGAALAATTTETVRQFISWTRLRR
jgi:hypothetical protein